MKSEEAQHSTVSQAIMEDTAKATKKLSILNAFTLKEPTLEALEKQQTQLRKQQVSGSAQQDHSIMVPSSSSMQLPANVARVNSKWDGLPQCTKPSRSSSKFKNKLPFLNKNQSSHASTSDSNGGITRSELSRPMTGSTSRSSEFDNVTLAESYGAEHPNEPMAPDTEEILANMCLGYNRKSPAKNPVTAHDQDLRVREARSDADILADMCSGYNKPTTLTHYEEIDATMVEKLNSNLSIESAVSSTKTTSGKLVGKLSSKKKAAKRSS